MRKSSANPSDPEYLYDLAQRVLTAYRRNRVNGKTDISVRFIDISTPPPNNARNSYYGYFVNDIYTSTDKSLGAGVICELLIRLRKDIKRPLQRSFEDYSIDAFELYANTIQTRKGKVSSNFNSLKLTGANFITPTFKASYEKDNENITRDEFYLNQGGNECQWYGVVRHWDRERQDYKKIKNHITDFFEESSCVLAVLHGTGGVGKSTILRRLAIELVNETFRVVWINDISLFCDNDLEQLASSKEEQYLIFLEDWQWLRNDGALADRFINKIKNISHVRLVLGDRSSGEHKSYYKYLYEGGGFEILPNDNDILLKHIVGINNKWENTVKKLLLSVEIYDAPIYLLIFIIARVSEGEIKTTTKKARSLFIEIISHDLTKIADHYPGLAAALYYFSNAHTNRLIYCTWRGLLKLADYFTQDNSNSKNLLSFDQSDEIIRIVSYYLTKKEFVCDYFVKAKLIVFHNTVLIEDGFKKLYFTGLRRYKSDMKAELADLLWNVSEKSAAIEVIFDIREDFRSKNEDGQNYTASDDFKNPEVIEIFRSGESSYVHLTDILVFDEMISEFYRNATIPHSDKYWLSCIYHLIEHVDIDGKELHKHVIKTIIDLGCKSAIVLQVYSYFLKDEIAELTDLLNAQTLLIMHLQFLDRAKVKIWFDES